MACPKCGTDFFTVRDADFEALLDGQTVLATCANDKCQHTFIRPGAAPLLLLPTAPRPEYAVN